MTTTAVAIRSAARWVPRRFPRTVWGRLWIMLLAAVAVSVAFGVATNLVLARQQNVVASLAADDGPASIDTARVHTALSDADQAAATSFLSQGAERLGGSGPIYQDKIKIATQGLAKVAAVTPAGGVSAEQVQAIEALIVVYIGLVDQAHANVDHGNLSVTYLAYASHLMHTSDTGILARVDQLAALDATQVARRGSTHWLSSAVIVAQFIGGMALITLLVGIQAFLARRFRRVLNPALCAATVLGIILLTLTSFQTAHTRNDIHDGVAALQGVIGAEMDMALLADDYGARARSLIAPQDVANALPSVGGGDAVDSLRVDRTAATMFAGATNAKRFSSLLDPVLRLDATEAERTAVSQANTAYREFTTIDQDMKVDASDTDADHTREAVLAPRTSRLLNAYQRTEDALGATAESTQRRFDTATHAAASKYWLGTGIPVLTGVVVLLLIIGVFPRLGEYR
ncbi:hypothetical protein [Frankia sp. CiP3]|uniref:hypothetical protein n=1 Tax=Frankia sp. CiP3 TaxID=2880971 RepID=UPI001EF5B537|nr:hypothetical protein [Frankia sp. CiP3]